MVFPSDETIISSPRKAFSCIILLSAIDLTFLSSFSYVSLHFQHVKEHLHNTYVTWIANFVRINRSEIVNLDVIDGFEGNCYYIGKNPLYATGVYRQRMEGVFIKAAIKRGQKSLLILLSVSRLGRRPRRSSSSYTPCA